MYKLFGQLDSLDYLELLDILDILEKIPLTFTSCKCNDSRWAIPESP